MIAAWVVAGLLSLAGALTYAELAAMMPRAGGEYMFIREGYGRPTGVPLRLDAVRRRVSGSQAAKGVGFAIFLNGLVNGTLDRPFFTVDLFGHPFPSGSCKSSRSAVIIAATSVNCLAVSVGGSISVFLTVAEDSDRPRRRRRGFPARAAATGHTSP